MSEHQKNLDIYARIRSNPRFAELTASRARANMLLFVLSMSAYLGLLLTVSLRPDILSAPLSSGGVATIAWPIGAAVVIFSWLLTLLHLQISNTQAEITNKIMKEAGL